MMIAQKLAVLSILFASVEAVSGKKKSSKAKSSKKSGKKSADEPVDECSAKENGIEVWKKTPNEDVKLRLTTAIDTDTCTYKMALSWEPNDDYPYIRQVTNADPTLANDTDYRSTCVAEGIFQSLTGEGPLTPEKNVGLQEFYTDYAFGIDVSANVQEYIGFKYVSLGASPCGTFLQPFPQYSVHFYDITNKQREELRCVSDGDYFCKPMDQQCSDSGRGFQMNGTGIPTCAGAPVPGPPVYQNLPFGYFWTLDGNAAVGINAASPAMGLHAVDPSEFLPTRDVTEPYTLYVGYESEVIGNHVLLWSGFAEGLRPDYTKETLNYNCQTEDKAYYPTKTNVSYKNGRTIVSIEGPLSQCTGPSFTEVVDSMEEAKGSKKSKSSKSSK
eukprot:CAMPEP_0198137042 /NCGR_PEP_ID=MMETSP1443-20131203/596_1 /TAXON_ID=186043 /ORGANISM="Entomoneis sp., Strain CCMP2396" /LENGTH=385 /DNA_ID=CAMNT_0043798367 /DNA_START=46 /DNA_END=1203 /DNA_ORIENTATION=+